MSGRRAPPIVAQVLLRLDYGGLENGVVNLVNRLPPERYRQAIICLNGFNDEFRSRIVNPDVSIISLNKKPGKDFAVYRRMYNALRQLGPDILHTRNLGTIDMQWSALAAGVRHRVHGEHGWEASDPRGQSLRHLRIRRACRPIIQRYVPMSQDIAKWLVRDVHVNPERIRQLYSGVDIGRFIPAASPPRDPVVIGTVGRLDPVKDQAALLTAIVGLKLRDPVLGERLRLFVVGDGPLREPLAAQAEGLGIADQVWFAGARSDTADIMRQMSVFVLPSLNEGISNTILEAMATGLPVVATRVGGTPELVLEGVTGALYEQGNSGALEAALWAYLTNPGLRLAHGAAGRARVVQTFSLDAMVKRYVDLYDELLNTGPSSYPFPMDAGEGVRRPGEGA